MFADRLATSLGGAVLFLWTGLGVVSAFPSLRRRPLHARLGFAWLFGVLVVGGGAWVASHLFHVPLRRSLFLPLALVGAAAQAGAVWRREERPLVGSGPSLPAGGVAIVCGFLTLGLLASGLSNPLQDWDGRQHWLAAARIVRAEGTVDARLLREGGWFVSHPRYPILEPLAVVAQEEIFNTTDDDRAARPFYVLFYPVWLVLGYHFARRRAGPTAAAFVALSAAMPYMTTFELWGGPTSAYSDLPLGCFLGTGFLLLIERDRLASTGFAAGLLLAGAILTKNEGAPFALIALGTAATREAWLSFRGRLAPGRGKLALARVLPILMAAIPVAGALLFLHSWRSGIVNRFDEGYDALSSVPRLVAGFKASFPLWGPEIPKIMLHRDKWGFFWPVAACVLAAGCGGLGKRVLLPLSLFLGGSFAVIVAAYSVGWADHADILARATWSRFLIQLSLPGFVLYAMALRECIRGVRGFRLGRATPGRPRIFRAWVP